MIKDFWTEEEIEMSTEEHDKLENNIIIGRLK